MEQITLPGRSGRHSCNYGGIFVNLWHGVAFCGIFLVIVKLDEVSRVIEGVPG